MRELVFILTACFALPKSEQKPEVTIYPKFKQVYSGDTLVMKCSGSGMLKWFFNTNHMEDQTKAIETWTINVISKNVSGSYHCQMAMLETPPEPAIVGKELILQCRVWGEPIISSTVFFKNGHEKQNTISSTLIIETVTIEDQGNYTCTATYKFRKNTSNIPNTVTSDIQELLVKVQPPEAVFIKRGSTLTCTCPKCPKPHSHRWYIYEEQRLMEFQDQKDILIPLNKESSYRCRAMWNDGVSTLSDQFRRMQDLMRRILEVEVKQNFSKENLGMI
ncbi:hypothetical protein SKAU_G00130820 [Synaphobranchus kaupii]|uniref:Ig-like domain-containing protein n=1 Tax=Synaphobranchus kaupii TaxID=118154 RepID=A0A9Q1J300_SYNKA|nr:hypothetical protein SKAU_G00130820 [Synaphobranchus kaupii]